MDTERFKDFGENVRRIRVAAGLSQIVIAERMGIDQGNYSRLERGTAKPTLQTLFRLSEALGCEPYELLLPTDLARLIALLKPLRAASKAAWAEAIHAVERSLMARSSG
jgi:transcriptional regulator with XRE-family HTH domain